MPLHERVEDYVKGILEQLDESERLREKAEVRRMYARIRLCVCDGQVYIRT